MKIIIWNDLNNEERLQQLQRCRVSGEPETIRQNVMAIIQQVRQFGDQALHQYTLQFDGVKLDNFSIDQQEWQQANLLAEKFKQAIAQACINIQRFHEMQLPKKLALDVDGIKVSKEFLPIDRVGLYIPGGTAPLVSTLLMLAIPAKIAGCQDICMVTPPSRDGRVNPAILYAAQLCGVTQLFKVGGAQAIAALAYGTNSIPKVSKIFGPGNQYVTQAKLLVSQDPAGAALDMPAGPSEVLIIADEHADPTWVAADLLAQAEHDVEARCLLVTPNLAFAEKVRLAVDCQIESLSRRNILQQSLTRGLIIITPDMQTCFTIANEYAPEHLMLQVDDPSQYKGLIQNAGSVFIGPWSAEALGDYASGPTHVLPTYGYAKSYSALGVESFMKAISFQEVNQAGFLKLAPVVEALAELEGLSAHQNSVVIRRYPQKVTLTGEKKWNG